MHASLNVGYQGKSGPGKIHEVILVYNSKTYTTYSTNIILTFTAIYLLLTLLILTLLRPALLAIDAQQLYSTVRYYLQYDHITNNYDTDARDNLIGACRESRVRKIELLFLSFPKPITLTIALKLADNKFLAEWIISDLIRGNLYDEDNIYI